ncbi:MAG: 16S rRNA (uracil(1498)-N(3))-methyltransferase [Deltaproteobacteria bacterium]|nr:16S rRNA (uracil(1498)-N(3))-methyltransferase [Deltaproteobacteria bacterium]
MHPIGLIKINRPLATGDACILQGDALGALLCWRPRIGEAFTVAGPANVLWRARLTSLEPNSASLLVFEEIGAKSEGPEIILLQALPEKERMELIIQKTTELGVDAICPFKSRRSISLAERDSVQRKSHRWQEAARKAARQCRRESIPVVHPCAAFGAALELASGAALKLILYEDRSARPLKAALRPAAGLSSIAVMSGPEGGFEAGEIAQAEAAGFVAVSLGTRILRAETAAIIAVGIAGYEAG